MMDTKDAQDLMRRVYLERDKARGLQGTLLRTFQEFEELSEAILEGHSKVNISDEIADVYAWLCSIANLLDIDISKAFYSKYTDACSKCKKVPCDCPPETNL
ncbi:MAG: MazG nucleotide pyrophosphohydrolase domain-containing protein [Candidatus Thorarchaeota archaeon]